MSGEQFFNLIVGCMITFGFAFAGAITDGPFGMFLRVRSKIASTTEKEWIRKGVECPICLSCWIGIPVSIALDGGVIMWAAAIGFTCVVTSLSPGYEGEE